MIEYERGRLANGLRVFTIADEAVPMAVVNVMYNVGSKDEREEKTGFAHLFEHLMFSGSANVPDFDGPLQRVGGSSNAFTSPDLTNYYDTLPADNLETAFWLESDRMKSLAFDPKGLEVQRSVVIEEFRQRYLNQPYGEIWHLLRDLAYKRHPYKWPTIGKEIAHVEEATMDEVRAFFERYYCPANAVLVVAGKVRHDEAMRLAEKWFADIPAGQFNERSLPQEPSQTAARRLRHEADVPTDAFYKVWHMAARPDPEYYAQDLLSDVLGRGKSSRLYHELVQKERLFSALNAFVTGSEDAGLFCVSGRLQEGRTFEEAEAAIGEQIEKLRQAPADRQELEKVKNQAESTLVYSELNLLPQAIRLAYAEIHGRIGELNSETERIQAVSAEDVQRAAQEVLREENSSTLHYAAKRSN